MASYTELLPLPTIYKTTFLYTVGACNKLQYDVVYMIYTYDDTSSTLEYIHLYEDSKHTFYPTLCIL